MPEKNAAGITKIFRHKATTPIILFAVVSITLTISLFNAERPPRLDSISPEIGEPGGVMVLSGSNFGSSRQGGSVLIAGIRPVVSSYLEWTDTRISVRIPDDVGSGLVSIKNTSGVSSGILFTNKNQIPVVISDTTEAGHPGIDQIEPTKASVGSVITITGLNFGMSRGNAKVFFTPIAISTDLPRENVGATQQLPGSEIDFDYESWTESVLKVRVPNGATSGNVRVSTDRGTSNSVYLEIGDTVGTKILRQKRGYQIHYSVEIYNVKSDEGGTLDLWIPGVLSIPEQRNIEMIKIPEPLWDDYLGLSRYQLKKLSGESTYQINQTYWLDRYAVETKINTSRILPYDVERQLFKTYTSADKLIRSDDESVIEAAKSAVGREKNVFLQAKQIYLFLLRQLAFEEKITGKTVLENYVSAEANAFTYTILYCSFARSIGIPTRPVAGYLVFGDRKSRVHYWAEFYLEGFGWVPLDATLGDGARFGSFPDIENPEEYYFGNLDSQHITFSRGIVDVKPLSPGSTKVSHRNLHSLQTIHEEASPEIKSYRADWKQLQIIDLW